MIRLVVDMSQQRSIMKTKVLHLYEWSFSVLKLTQGPIMYHLRYPNDIVVTTTDEPNQGFPGILLEYSYSGKLRGLSFKICVGAGPVFIQLSQVWTKVQKVMYERFAIINFFNDGGGC